LRTVLSPLHDVPQRTPAVAFVADLGRARTVQTRAAAKAAGATRLAQVPPTSLDLNDVFKNYEKRLPQEWIRWMSWAHWAYVDALPHQIPDLRDAIEALIAVESQLHVSSKHPNRDHVVHPLADAELAVALYDLARARRPRFDSHDWSVLRESVPGLTDTRATRARVVRCGLALAGLFHDVGYLRYIGEAERIQLGRLGIVAPPSAFDLWSTPPIFADSYLDRVLGGDARFGDLFDWGLNTGKHGPFAAFMLASTALRLRSEGRLPPEVDAVFQLAAAAAALHEVHGVDCSAWPSIERIASRLRGTARKGWSLPGLFRIVDDLHCWARPSLVPERRTARVVYGADGCTLHDDGRVEVRVSKKGDGGRERQDLIKLQKAEGPLFARLGIEIATSP
jgi:hypothetical protein